MRLIDADAVKEIIMGLCSVDTYADKVYVCERIDALPAISLPGEKDPRVLPLEEILDSSGSGWAEWWFAPDPEEGEPENFELMPCAWVHGCMVTDDSDISTSDMVKRHYGKKYGLRIWTRRPTQEQREAVAWARSSE